jgi:sugar (pentulose or hexulose) kinase
LTREAVTLIFDIGKTTKKVLLFDQESHVLEEQTENFSEITDDDGFPCEGLTALTNWANDRLQYFLNHPKYTVTHINHAAYGASLVHIGHNGNAIEPFYNYLKPLPKACEELFLKKYNANNDISAVTASPYLGLLNSGLQLFMIKYCKPELFSRISTTLHFPQYFSYLLTNKKFTDITSIGCHTMLWDFKRNDYHSWVEEEGLRKLFPPVTSANTSTDFQHKNTSIKVGIGVHDSSAALMPYLVTMKEKFMLLSTGTWNICFNPFNDQLLTENELKQDCLCFFTYDGKPVKASRIFLGHEHELQQKALAKHFSVESEFYKTANFNADLFRKINEENVWVKFRPLGMEGTGPALIAVPAKTNYSSFKSFEEAQHHLIRQLVRWQKLSIDLVDPANEVRDLIVVGGFTKNKLFLEIMKAEMPERNVLLSDHPRAAALGASWLVNRNYAGKHGLLKVGAV